MNLAEQCQELKKELATIKGGAFIKEEMDSHILAVNKLCNSIFVEEDEEHRCRINKEAEETMCQLVPEVSFETDEEKTWTGHMLQYKNMHLIFLVVDAKTERRIG